MYVLATCWAYEEMIVLPHLFTDEQVKEITLKNDSRILIDFDDVIFSTLKIFFKSSCDFYMFIKVNAVSNDIAERIIANTAFDRAEKQMSDEIVYGEPKETNYLASIDVEIEKEHRRKVIAEKSKAKVKRKTFKAGSFLTKKQKRFGKRTLHRFNRRNWEVPYHKGEGNFGQILWDMT